MKNQSSEQKAVARQYHSSDTVNARAALHRRFSADPRWQEWVFDQFNLPCDCRILEVGCGPGMLWQANRARIPTGWRLVLSDMSVGMLRAVRENIGDLPQIEDIIQVDAQAIPYEDASFDAVIAKHMLYHVPEFSTALSEISRVLKPGGILYATASGNDHMREFWELLTPFVEDIHQRMNPQETLERFSLDNAPSRLTPWFTEIQVRHHQNTLVVTEVEPLVAYAQSIANGDVPILEGERLMRFRELVAERIRQAGAYHITNSSGIVIARVSRQ